MNKIIAIGFDLFNTLLIADPQVLDDAMRRLINSLQQSGFNLENDQFKEAYQKAALEFVKEAQKDGIETHNRFWICAALNSQGYNISPHDPRIAIAVDNYFLSFFVHCHLIPGTKEILSTLKNVYRLGLLTNFTHGPAVRKIINDFGLSTFFDVVLISGELGFRKPHSFVFHKLIEHLGVGNDQIIYIGDDMESDINGALRSGLQPVLTTYVRDQNIPFITGITSRGAEIIDCTVPKISMWKDLLSLLDRG
ncbi:MAG: HAD family hydrolase [Bacteroidota bacterium]